VGRLSDELPVGVKRLSAIFSNRRSLEEIKTNRLKVDHPIWKYLLRLIDKRVDTVGDDALPRDVTNDVPIELGVIDEVRPLAIERSLLVEQVVHFRLGHALISDFVTEPPDELFVGHGRALHKKSTSGLTAPINCDDYSLILRRAAEYFNPMIVTVV
jgi:hypothetical protein